MVTVEKLASAVSILALKLLIRARVCVCVCETASVVTSFVNINVFQKLRRDTHFLLSSNCKKEMS